MRQQLRRYWRLGLMLLFALMTVVALSAAFLRPLPVSPPVVYTLPPGTPVRHLVLDLYHKGYIQHPLLLEIALRIAGRPIQAGEYDIHAEKNLYQLVNDLQEGRVHQYSITLLEGWRFSEALDNLWTDPVLERRFESPEAIQEAFSLQQLEGAFFPDTYFFTRGQSDRDILEKARKRQEKITRRIWKQGCHPQLPNENALLTLASIVEKEVAEPSERSRVANVLLNRLEKRMRLQADPTVYFALDKPLQERLTRADLQIQSPYNTYTTFGLPPGPIAMVSRRTLEATCHGLPGDKNLYYVSRGDGTHTFSETLAAHNEAVQRYRQGQTNDN